MAVVDSLPELGGQVSALYPEKPILDVAGFPTVKGRELVEQLVEQAASAQPTYLLDRTATGLTIDAASDGGVTMALDDGSTVRAKVVIITAGIGKFTPRPLPAGDGWEGRGLVFFVPSFAEYAGRDVVIVGGGDSAFDWAHSLRADRLVGHAGAPARQVPRPPGHRRRGARLRRGGDHQGPGHRAHR